MEFAVIEDDPVHVLVNFLALLHHAVIIQQLGENVIGSRVNVFSLIGLHGFAVFGLAHGPAHEGEVVAVDRLEDLFGAVFRDQRLFANGDQVPQGIELVGPDVGVLVSGLGVETGEVILEFLALLVLPIAPQFLEAVPAFVEHLLDVRLAGFVLEHAAPF